MAKTLIVDFDGTWLSRKDERPSNVQKIHDALSDDGQMALYIPGVGSGRGTTLLGKYLGGAFGVGAHGRRNKAYKWLKQHWEPGDRICIFAFSRGAAIGRMLAYLISKKGIRKNFKKHDVKIDFLGCWDTVASFGIPFNVGPIKFQSINLFSNLEVGLNVRHAVHLVALDENRESFLPSLMNQRPGIHEVWMIGTHSDIGGGEPDAGLSDITLAYMMDRAQEAGINFKTLKAIKPNPDGTIHAHKTNLKPELRKVVTKVADKIGPHFPTLHRSVLLRKSYMPLAIVNLAQVTYTP